MNYFSQKSLATILTVCILLSGGMSVNAASLKNVATQTEEITEVPKERKVIKKKSAKSNEKKKSVKSSEKSEKNASKSEKVAPKKSEARLALEQKQKAGTMKMKDFVEYINKEYGSLDTSVGKLTFTTNFIDNRTSPSFFHYLFKTDYTGVDLEKLYHHGYTKEQETELLKVLKEEQLSIYKDAVHFFPQYKFSGGYYKSRTWEELQNDLYDIEAFTWFSHWDYWDLSGREWVDFHWLTSGDTFDFKPDNYLDPLI